MKLAILWGVLARSWSLISGLITVSLIASCFTLEQQGFYYTFGSILALQIFFESGLSTVLMQFSGYEFSKIKWLPSGELDGDPVSIGRFLSLSKKGTFWFIVASFLFFIILLPAGLLFFHQQDSALFSWRIPWCLAVIGTALNLACVPFWGVLSGAGQIHLANMRSLFGGMLGCVLAWFAIYLNFGLYSVFLFTMGNAIVSWGILFAKFRVFLWLVLCHKSGFANDIVWWKDIWPMQWKIGLSWASGYLSFQLFTPVLFAFQSPKIAGQMGLTLAMGNAILATAIVWTGARNPEMCRLIALKEWHSLDFLFRRLMGETTIVGLFGGIAGSALVWYLEFIPGYSDRFLPLNLVVFQCFSSLLTIWIYNMATYCRAHKIEPFLGISIVGAIFQSCVTWIAGKYYSVDSLIQATMALNLLYGIPATVYVFQKQRKSHD